MRPVEKLKPDDKLPSGKVVSQTYAPYGKAKDDLIENLGKFCSFCEVPVPPKSSLEVEHVRAKSILKYSALIHSWSNFLLGCKNCNSIKDAKDFELEEIHLPHLNNTFLSFEIKAGGLLQVCSALNPPEKEKAEKLSWLVGIERRPGHPQYSRKDDRWQNRYEAWNKATKYLRKYEQGCELEVVVDLAIECGFFSVWMTVFAAHPEVRQALINRFPGTAKACFDAQTTVAINRNGGSI